MTASSGEGRPGVGAHDFASTTASRPESHAAAERPRPLEQIFPIRGDASRGREMQATWRSFCRDRSPAVRIVLATGTSPPEIAYQLGELLHNHFRTRGVTLTSYELRRLVAELLVLHGPQPGQEEKSSGNGEAPPVARRGAVVAFDGAFSAGPSSGGAAPRPGVPERELQPRVSGSAAVLREPAPFGQLLTRALELVRGRLASRDRQAARTAVDEAVNSIAGEHGGELTPATRERLVTSALSEVVGLGLIDRLWSDRTVCAILINGPSSVLVEREGVLQAVPEGFRDQRHLLELMDRLVTRPASGIAGLRLRDGSNGVVIFPPVAPAGPVLILRRARPGEATLERMIASGLLDQPIADLLRLGARSRLNMLVAGPSGSGKTALLAAVIRDLDAGLRIVTVAHHRQFRLPVASGIELVASSSAPFAMLIEAGAQLEPGLLVLDSVQADDVTALSTRLRQSEAGTLASLRPEAMSAVLAQSADLIMRIDRVGGGPFRVVAVEDSAGNPVFRHDGIRLVRGTEALPAFAAAVRARGHGEVLAQLLR